MVKKLVMVAAIVAATGCTTNPKLYTTSEVMCTWTELEELIICSETKR